jgi:hypothetical protein
MSRSWSVELVLERKKQIGCVLRCTFVISTSLSFAFFVFSLRTAHHLSYAWSVSPCFEYSNYQCLSLRGEGFDRGCSMWSIISPSLLYSHSFLYGGVWWSWYSTLMLLSIPDRHHFPTGEIKVLPPKTFLPHRAIFISISQACTTTRPHRSIAPPASRSVVYSVRWDMHSIGTSTRSNSTTKGCRPLADSIPKFFWFGRFLCMRSIPYGAMPPFTRTLCSNSFFLWMPISTQRVWVWDTSSISLDPSTRELLFAARAM